MQLVRTHVPTSPEMRAKSGEQPQDAGHARHGIDISNGGTIPTSVGETPCSSAKVARHGTLKINPVGSTP